MLQIRAFSPPDRIDAVVSTLVTADGVANVLRGGETEEGRILVTADVEPECADAAFDVVSRSLPSDSVALLRVEGVEAEGASRPGWLAHDPSTLAWTEVVAEARASSRLLGRYLALMGVAGVVAGTGVIESSTILIIGAMAISPDLLPLAAACVGLVGRRPRLVRRSVGTLATGLAASTITAAVATVILRTFDVYDGDLGAGGIHGLVTTDPSTILVALAAGVAAMLTYESRAGAAVGVAISVTTIPASAYLGVAAASSQRADALGAAGVLGTNLICLLLSGTATLAIQRWILARRAEAAPT